MAKNGQLDKLYSDTIVEMVRTQYSINAELAIQRQRDNKPEDFEAYNTFVENCKNEAYRLVYGEEHSETPQSANFQDYQEQLERLGVE